MQLNHGLGLTLLQVLSNLPTVPPFEPRDQWATVGCFTWLVDKDELSMAIN
jgi:1,2-phenylacetyl-CoA epoxidase catalytic subunit